MNNMMYSRGNLVFSDDEGNSVYEDGTVFDDSRPCSSCDISCGTDEPDPCLGWLNAVDYACCGHGIAGEAYVQAGGIKYDSVEAWREATMG